MVKVYYCDRCDKEILPKEDSFGEIFNSFSFDKFEKNPLLKPLLCKKCQKGYDKILIETNDKIADYLDEKESNKKSNKSSGKKFWKFRIVD